MAVATGTSMLIATAITAATSAYSSMAQRSISRTNVDFDIAQAQTQAKTLEMQAQAERTQAEVDELERQRTLERIISAQNAVFGASGFTSTSGSFANIQTTDAAKAAEAKKLNQTFTDTRQVGFQNNIRQIQSQAAFTRSASKIARRTSGIRDFGSMISTAVTAYGAYKKPTIKGN